MPCTKKVVLLFVFKTKEETSHSPSKPGIALKPPSLGISSRTDSSPQLSPIDKPAHNETGPTVQPIVQHIDSMRPMTYTQPFLHGNVYY